MRHPDARRSVCALRTALASCPSWTRDFIRNALPAGCSALHGMAVKCRHPNNGPTRESRVRPAAVGAVTCRQSESLVARRNNQLPARVCCCHPTTWQPDLKSPALIRADSLRYNSTPFAGAARSIAEPMQGLMASIGKIAHATRIIYCKTVTCRPRT